jgi:tetratricopeptide (TPR) repeat protein
MAQVIFSRSFGTGCNTDLAKLLVFRQGSSQFNPIVYDRFLKTMTSRARMPGATRRPAGTSGPATHPRRELWLLRLSAASLPLLLIVVLELALRLAGYGYPTRFFTEVRGTDGRKYLINSETFSLRFFRPRLARWPGPFKIATDKPKDARRIFIFGESAAMGDPQPAYGASRYLEVLLRERFPAHKFEVVNLGITAVNSHVILPMAQEVAARGQGDIWIIYMGNNEMVGPFGAATVFGARAPSLWKVRLILTIQKWRVGQLAMALARKLGNQAGDNTAWGGMGMFLQNQVPPEDPHKERVYGCFEQNLRGILEAGIDSGARVILSTMSANLRDFPPLASMMNSNQPAIQQEQFNALYRTALGFERQSNFVEAARCFEQAAGLNPRFAELHFRWGRCLLQMTNFAGARARFQAACDNDALPFRADRRINSTIRALGKEFESDHCALCDAETDLQNESPAGVAGNEVFFEHVHFNSDGNYRLARSCRLARSWAGQAERMILRESERASVNRWATQEECERALGLADFNRAYVLQSVARRLEQPPLSGQFNNAERLQRIRAEEAGIQDRLQSADASAKTRELFRAALADSPDDHYLYEGLANFLESIGDYAGAEAAYGRCAEILPQDFYARLRLGSVLAKEARLTEAIGLMRQATRIRPSVPDAWYELASAQVLSGDYAGALKNFDRACDLRPRDPASRYYRLHCKGKLLAQHNRHAEAMEEYREAIETLPGNWEAHFELGGELDEANQLDKARNEFAESVRLNPNYSRTHFNHGVLLAKVGQLDGAQREFEETLRLEPANSSAREYLAQVRAMKRQRP